jgi:hypothetical protein
MISNKNGFGVHTPYGYGFDGVMYVLYITTPCGYGFVGAMFVWVWGT